jgi:chromate transporter
LRTHERLTATLSTVTAAVAGVILNLALWFGWHVIFPGKQQVDWFAFGAAAITFLGMAKWKWTVVPVVLGGALAGWIYRSITSL